MTLVRLAIVASFLFAIGLAFLQPGHQGGALSRMEGQLLDLRFLVRGAVEPPQDIVILAIDDLALAQTQAFPLPRNVIAQAIEAVRQNGAQAIALDLLLTGPTEHDTVLAAALDPRTAIALSLTEIGSPLSAQMERRIEENRFTLVRNRLPEGPKGMLGPQQAFAERAQLGHVNLRLDDDGALRRFPVAMRYGDGAALPALAVVAARLKAGEEALSLVSGETLILGDRQIPLGADNMAVLNYFGPRGTIKTLPILQAETADVAGKLVFIGGTADGYRDSFETPFDTAFPGVEALATLAANILDGTTLRRDQSTWVLDVLLAIIGAMFAAFAASRARPLWAFLGSLSVWGAGLVILQTGFVNTLWLDATTLIGALILGTLLGFAARWETNRQRALNLSRYQPPQLVEALAGRSTPAFDGRLQRAAILFVDLADFTKRTEDIGSGETVKLLNRFHTLVNDAVRRWNGVVFFTAGDGAMILFGLPEVAPDDAKRALSCAQELLVTISADDLIAAAPHPTPVRIGAHSGEVQATVLGKKGRSTPTVTGDVVNTASRLQEQAKIEGAILAISNEIYQEAGQPDVPGLYNVGPVMLRGRRQSLDLWLLGPSVSLEQM